MRRWSCRAALAAGLLLTCAACVAARELEEVAERPLAASGGRRLLATTTLDLSAAGTTSGRTPLIFGANLGHRYPGSNWALWMKRLGVNSARAFLGSLWGDSLQTFVGGSTAWGRALNGSLVDTQAGFTAAVAALRTPAGHNPANATSFSYPVQWSKFESRWNATTTTTKADAQEGSHGATLAALAALHPNQPPLVGLGLGLGQICNSSVLNASDPLYWRSRWEQYKHVYGFSRFLWLRGVRRIEVYNEPELDNDFQATSTTYKTDLWLETMALRSAAVQHAYADLSAEQPARAGEAGRRCGAFAKTTYASGNLGQPSVQALHRTFARTPNPDPSWFNMHTYSYHSYGQSGKGILANLRELVANSSADRAAVGGPVNGFSVTEHNAATSGTLASSADTMEMPAQAAKLASQALNYASAGAGLASIFMFKFSVTLSTGNGVTKNGIHWGDNTGAPYNIGDSTLAAEGFRLVAERLAGAKPIQNLTSVAAASLTDAKAPLPINNLVRIRVPATAVMQQTLAHTAAAHVRAGASSATNYGALGSMCVGTNSSTTHASTYASAIQFSVPNPSLVASAVLKLTVASLSAGLSANMPLLLLGFSTPSSWTSANVTWDRLSGASGGPLLKHPPAGAASTWKVDRIANNFVNYNSTGLSIAGHVTLPSGLTAAKAARLVKMVDVTPFVRASSGPVSIVLLRPFRNNAETASGSAVAADTLNGGAFACFTTNSTQAADRPALLLQ